MFPKFLYMMGGMNTLRDRKKLESRQKMLDVAKRLFIERGYSKTTMEDIADQAGFGVATLYTYFRTKEGVFAAMARVDMSELQEAGERALENPGDDPLRAIWELLTIYNRVYDYISWGLMSEFIANTKTKGPLRETAVWVQKWQADQIARVLVQGQVRGQVSADLDTTLASEVIIDLLLRYNTRSDTATDLEPAFQRLKLAVGLVLEGWLN